MKRFIPLALIVPLAIAGCSSSKPSSTASSTTATTSSSSPTSSGSGTANMNLSNPTSAVALNESGSSLLYPFLQELVTPLAARYSNVHLAPAAGGSGKGISDAIAGTSQMGGSDAYLSQSQQSANPTLMNVPIAVSSQVVDYNVKGVSNIKLTGNILAEIYEGKIKTWNDPAIAAINSGVNLPSQNIVPVRRVDSSGDTFLFTSFLTATNQTWSNGPSMGTTVTWPAVSGELTANGNPGMVQTCSATPGCIAYVGISAQNSAVAAGLETATLQNKAGNFVSDSATTVSSAVNAGSSSIPANLAVSLIYEPGSNSYPIVNFEYIIVKSKQSSADTALAIRDFLAFAIDPTGGSSPQYLQKEQFQALPTNVTPQVQTAIAKISG